MVKTPLGMLIEQSVAVPWVNVRNPASSAVPLACVLNVWVKSLVTDSYLTVAFEVSEVSAPLPKALNPFESTPVKTAGLSIVTPNDDNTGFKL